MRSAAPTSTARVYTRASSAPATTPTASRSTPSTSIGRTTFLTRSAAPTSTARAPTRSFITSGPYPADVEVDANHVYWSNSAAGTIGRANLDGTGVDESFVDGSYAGGGPYGVAVDANHVYWTNFVGDTIGRANIHGTGVDNTYITGASSPPGVAVDANHIYWTNNYTGGTVGRANLDGTGVNQTFIVAGLYPNGIAIDANHVYWSNGTASAIGRANLDGTGVNQSFIRRGYVQGVAVDALSPAPTGKASVSVQGTALVVAAAPGAKDNLAITRPSRFTFRVTDFPSAGYTGSVVHAGPGCTPRGDYTANCPASGITPVLPVLVTSGDRADKVVNSSGLPGSLYGEGGDDVLIGGPDRDILKGGPGTDAMRGLHGNDLLRARDGASDERIDCGRGSDFGDLDRLPKDPNSKVNGCETKTRH